MVRRIPDKLKTIFTDTIWSMAGLVLMNVAAQFVVYPYWNRVLGSEAYGNIVYLLAVMNILAISIGSGVNYTRMRQSANGETRNRPYQLLMAAGTVLTLLVLLVLYFIGLLHIGPVEFVLFCLLTAATMWRYYADVEYRLHINYRGYFLYYLVIGLGYLIGMTLFRATGLWPLALLPGELAGLVLVLWRGSVFIREKALDKVSFSPVLRLALLLIGSNILSSLIFNGDRLVLRWFVGGNAVSIYYIASLFGKTMTLVTSPLNGVLIGHLAKYKGMLTKQIMLQITALSVAAVLLATIACVAASIIVLPFLYPIEYAEVRSFLLIGSITQVIYFVGNVINASVLLRFTPVQNQLIINVVHGVLFVAVCIPLSIIFGIKGFCMGQFVVNLIRLLMSVLMGFKKCTNTFLKQL